MKMSTKSWLAEKIFMIYLVDRIGEDMDAFLYHTSLNKK